MRFRSLRRSSTGVRLAAMRSVRTTTRVMVACSLLTTLCTIVQLGLLAHGVALLFLSSARTAQVLPWGLALLTATLLRTLCTILTEAVVGWSGSHTLARLRALLLTHIAALGPTYTNGETAGELVSTASEGVERLDPYLTRYLPQRTLSVVLPLTIAAIITWQDLFSGILLLATAPLIPLLMVLVGSYANAHITAQWQALTRLSGALLDAIQGLPTLVLYRRGPSVTVQVERLGEEFRRHTMRVLRLAFLNSLVLEFMTTASIALVAVELGVRLLTGGVAFERAFWILLLAPEYFRPLRDLGTHRHAAMESTGAIERIEAVLSTTSTVRALGQPSTLPTAPLTIAIHDLTLHYPGAKRPALDTLTLTLRAGTRTALVGPSGAGKSTLIALLMGNLRPDAGTITVNGVALESLDVEEWRRLIALVPQRPYLFHGTVRDNLRLSRPEASVVEIARAVEMAGADAFIAALPRGYDTLIGERGARLSGGQAQRLAIARALLKDTPLIIFDEPTAHLDSESESALRQAMEGIERERTVLVVAHRLNTVYTADVIAVLDAGRLVELGTHSDLYAGGGLYRRLVGEAIDRGVEV